MVIGEDKNKISNIVHPNVDQFNSLYQPHISQLLEPVPHNTDLLQLKVSPKIFMMIFSSIFNV